MKIRINFPGPLTTVQDEGRLGYMNVGFSSGGAMDSYSMRLANILVGNSESEGVLEMTFMGISAEFDFDAVIAITGADMCPTVNGSPIHMYSAFGVHSGDILEMKSAKKGMRTYLSVAGGFNIDPVMGSLSTNLKCKIGGFEGRKLRVGDEIFCKRSTRLKYERSIPKENAYSNKITVRVILGPQADYFTDSGIETFFTSEYKVSDKSDRMGIRLDGEAVANISGVDIVSDAIAMGSVQIPASGTPIIMMADRQTTGGYAKIATVISADLSLLAQAKPGDRVVFAPVSESTAVKLLKKQKDKISAIKRKLNNTK